MGTRVRENRKAIDKKWIILMNCFPGDFSKPREWNLIFFFSSPFFSNENSNRIQFIKHFDHFEMLDWIIIITKIIIILIAYSIIEFDVESLERERNSKFEFFS